MKLKFKPFLSAVLSGYLVWISPKVPNGWGVLTMSMGIFGLVGSFVYAFIVAEE